MLKIGSSLPEFALRDAQRDEITQDNFADSISVFAFYPMAFTGG